MLGVEEASPPVKPGFRIPALLPNKLRGFRRPRLWEEVLFIGISYFLYSLIRNGVPTHEHLAFQRGAQLDRKSVV